MRSLVLRRSFTSVVPPVAPPAAAAAAAAPPAKSKKELPLTALTAVTSVDGRYGKKTRPLRFYCSEFALIRKRIEVEVKWVQLLCSGEQFPWQSDETKAALSKEFGLVSGFPKLSREANLELEAIYQNFSLQDAETVKEIEKTTNHDVKAVEYFLRERVEASDKLKPISELIHICCTSEDINNTAYSLMFRDARDKVLLPNMDEIIVKLAEMSIEFANQPMLSRTHGQPATPSTLGKELANYSFRLAHQRQQVASCQVAGKFNGAVGNYAAHMVAMPEVNWPRACETFVTRDLQLSWNPYTTQIEPHDALAELFHGLIRFNNVLLDLNRDMWQYCSSGLVKQKTVATEVGSSTMPHKVNPIDFENSEGNIGIANAMYSHFASKLQVSRLQRDLSDSTVLRQVGAAFAHSLISFESSVKGLRKLSVNEQKLQQELNDHWEVLAEPIQTVMRRYHVANAYELLKEATKGKAFSPEDYKNFVKSLQLPEGSAEAKQRLVDLTPATYVGLSQHLAETLVDGHMPSASYPEAETTPLLNVTPKQPEVEQKKE
ncbi:adenylosuccinate lyase [Batrachochytrium salamandrivorans]|nr:adenylosuccinate lyase [Batrachochytrium salamandrivorans]